MLCVNCKHEERYHAIAKNHVLGTSHCTKYGCYCKQFEMIIGDETK